MCVAAPGRIIEIADGMAKIEYSSNVTTASLGIVEAAVGDWVLVHAGLVIQVLSGDDADRMRELFEELEALEA